MHACIDTDTDAVTDSVTDRDSDTSTYADADTCYPSEILSDSFAVHNDAVSMLCWDRLCMGSTAEILGWMVGADSWHEQLSDEGENARPPLYSSGFTCECIGDIPVISGCRLSRLMH